VLVVGPDEHNDEIISAITTPPLEK